MTADVLAQQLKSLDAAQVTYAAQFVEKLLAAAALASASDVHLHPVPGGIEIRWRRDGVLQTVGVFSRGQATDVVARLARDGVGVRDLEVRSPSLDDVVAHLTHTGVAA